MAVQTSDPNYDPQTDLYYDPDKDLYYAIRGGQRIYASPAVFEGQSKGTGHGATKPTGGVFHDDGEWNQGAGVYDQGLNWANIGALAVGGGLGLGALSAAGVVGGGAGGAGATAAADSPELVGTAAGPGATTIAAGTQPSSFIAGAAGEGGAATAIPSGAAAALPSAAPVLGSAAGAPVASAASTEGIWHALTQGSVVGPLINAGANLGGAAIQANAQNNATEAQAKATQAALDFQKQKLAEEDARLAPYRALGGNAASRLGSLWGLSTTSAPGVTPPAPTTLANPTGPGTNYQPGMFMPHNSGPGVSPLAPQFAQTSGSMSSFGGSNASSGGLITMIAPTGESQQVPAALQAYYLGKGAHLAPAGAA